MSRIMEEMRNEVAAQVTEEVTKQVTEQVTAQAKAQIALNLLAVGKLTNEEIANCMGLDLSEVNKLEQELLVNK